MAGFKQEMPPLGGYAPFEYAKKQKPRWVKGKYLLGGYLVYTYCAFTWHHWYMARTVRKDKRENREACIACEPLLLAERNRLFLKRLLVNREEEAEIMKDVPGWIQGTYLGSPVYHNKTFWGDPSAEEFWVHSDYNKGYYGQQFERLYH